MWDSILLAFTTKYIWFLCRTKNFRHLLKFSPVRTLSCTLPLYSCQSFDITNELMIHCRAVITLRSHSTAYKLRNHRLAAREQSQTNQLTQLIWIWLKIQSSLPNTRTNLAYKRTQFLVKIPKNDHFIIWNFTWRINNCKSFLLSGYTVAELKEHTLIIFYKNNCIRTWGSEFFWVRTLKNDLGSKLFEQCYQTN